ncbi:MAG: elongation factor Ts [Herpetosiphonaceae bacterium]|nr:MAG: elongation factor Ts [Herpetosiphonaceae bacterium]
MTISMDQVKELRERTGAGILECKKILEQTGGDMDKAIAILRERGLEIAAKKAGRVANDGRIEIYMHPGNRVAAMVELNCETDFVARTDDFVALAKDIAMQVAAMNPRYVRPEDVPAEERESADNPAKFDEEFVLLSQPFVRNPSQTIAQKIQETIAKVGENIVVRRFVRYEIGA